MSAPTSVKMMHPLFIDPKIRRNYFHITSYIIHIWFSILPVVFIEIGYFGLWNIAVFSNNLSLIVFLMILIPFNILVGYYTMIFSSLLIMKIRLIYLNLRLKPREGIFPRDVKDKDYKYLNLRNYSRLFPSYLISSSPFLWLRKPLFFSAFNIKIGKKGVNKDCWITPEFVEIGNNVIIGQASSIFFSLIENDKLIIKKIKIEDDVIIGAKVSILPGVHVKRGTIISAESYILPLSKLDENSIYFGNPVKLIGKLEDQQFFHDI